MEVYSVLHLSSSYHRLRDVPRRSVHLRRVLQMQPISAPVLVTRAWALTRPMFRSSVERRALVPSHKHPKRRTLSWRQHQSGIL